MMLVNARLNKDPDDMAALMMAACIVSRESCWGTAYNLLKRVVDKAPAYPEIYNNLGMAASSLASSTGKDRFLDEAESLLRKARKKANDGQSAAILANLALVLLHKKRLDESISTALECIALDPESASAHETLGYCYLHRGQWEPGFGHYEFTLGGKYRKHPGNPYWEPGQRDMRLFVQGEQGIGDELTYASVIPDAAKHHKILYECDARLEGLMRRSLPGVEVHGTRFERDKPFGGEFDAKCLVGSLCREYRQKDEDFPRTGYLVADPERRLQWKALLDTFPGRKVGIAWTGGLDNTFKHRRSFSLEALLPILKTPGITWVALQYHDATEEVEAIRRHGVNMQYWPRAVDKHTDYDEAAALVSELDCSVSVTTAMVHLHGALGKKCFVLVPNRNRWFYSSDTARHRWYDSLELYRQDEKWPIEKVAQRLEQYLNPVAVDAGGCAPPVLCA